MRRRLYLTPEEARVLSWRGEHPYPLMESVCLRLVARGLLWKSPTSGRYVIFESGVFALGYYAGSYR